MRKRSHNPTSALLTFAQAQAEYGLTQHQIYRLAAQGLAVRVVAGRNMIQRTDLDAALRAGPRLETGKRISPHRVGRRAAAEQITPAEARERERDARAKAERKAKADAIRAKAQHERPAVLI